MTARAKTRLQQFKDRASGKVIGADGILRNATEESDLNILAAHTFNTPAGGRYLAYLRSITVNHVHGPGVGNDELRHLEGQRYIVALTDRRLQNAGNRGPGPIERSEDGGEPEPGGDTTA